ncbi:hypothetical protein LWI28_027476 [Acer negundo]|uniref:Bromo domain-containing protein n=1 Tax=Acer negundo TaxID=4023 RepID=A0AAD5IXF5_ACENE|nr:hypothetical protein LWI28_027476 [Acer negundo]
MKRKRGTKKGKLKGAAKVSKNETVSNVISLNNSNNMEEYGNDGYESAMEVDTPSSTGTDQPINVANINPDGSIDKAVGKPVGRVKVKLKTSKMLDSSHSDTDKSSSQIGLERQGGIGERMEDSAISLAEMKMGVLGSALKKAGSIKIKSRVLDGSFVRKTGNDVAAHGESSYQKEPKTPHVDSQFNKEELDAALSVIKKVMKMDAAEPFNAPVNPEALGIPDYFDVIDTPMDFGTICSNLESDKYMNSEDVYNDVQYIWENCNKYNNKGDYILDLMKRVKKNFMKYWTAAGLYNEQLRGSNGIESIQVEDVSQSSQGKLQVKGQSKQKPGKRHGRRHKHDCLCAICVLKRRKREREENARITKGQTGVIDVQESKQEESSLVESPGGEDSSSGMGESRELDADAEVEGRRNEMKGEDSEQQYSRMEEKHEEEEEEEEEEEDEEEEVEGEEEEENEIEIQKKGEGEVREVPNRQSEPGLTQKYSTGVQTYSRRHEQESAAVKQQKHKLQESQEREEKAKMYEKFHFEDPMLLNLCGILFPDNHKSLWSGPHSLVPQRGSGSSNSIHEAIKTFMK